MAGLLGLTVNMVEAFHESYMMLVTFYTATRAFMGLILLSAAFTVPMVQGMMIGHFVMAILPLGLWIGSIYVEMPNRFVLIWLAIFLDLCGPMFLYIFTQTGHKISRELGLWIARVFEFVPAMNIEHKTNRQDSFVALVFGYSVIAILYQNSAHYGLNAFFGKAVLGLVQAFCFNWIYFELDGSGLFSHAIRRSAWSAMGWSTIHLPFVLSWIISASALSKLVVAADITHLDPHDLTHHYEEKSKDYIPDGIRWCYCVGLGLALACMGIISLCHIHKDAGPIRMRKRYRLANRWAICVALCCLPLAHNLNSLQLISITTSFIIYVLTIDLWGTSCAGDSLIGGDKKCKYIARCKISKKDLESAVKDGHVIKLEELSESGEKGVYHH